MNRTLEALIQKFGVKTIIARILEQLKLLALSEEEEVKDTAKKLIKDCGCDTEYLFNLCEYTNLVAFTSDKIEITDSPWNDDAVRACL